MQGARHGVAHADPLPHDVWAASVRHTCLRTRGQLSVIYASQRLKLPFDGVLLIGY